MFEITSEMSIKLREIRGRNRGTLEMTANEIGISSKTLSLIEKEKKNSVRKTVYEKITKYLFREGWK